MPLGPGAWMNGPPMSTRLPSAGGAPNFALATLACSAMTPRPIARSVGGRKNDTRVGQVWNDFVEREWPQSELSWPEFGKLFAKFAFTRFYCSRS